MFITVEAGAEQNVQKESIAAKCKKEEAGASSFASGQMFLLETQMIVAACVNVLHWQFGVFKDFLSMILSSQMVLFGNLTG